MITPGSPNGSTAVRIISHRVAPRASAPSLWVAGVWSKTSRLIAVMIGRIMIASTSRGQEDRAGRHGALRAEQRDPAQVGLRPVLQRGHVAGQQPGTPQAVDDRGDGGQQVDERCEGAGQPWRGVLGEEERHPDRYRYRQDHGHDRADHGDPEQVGDAEAHRRPRDLPDRGRSGSSPRPWSAPAVPAPAGTPRPPRSTRPPRRRCRPTGPRRGGRPSGSCRTGRPGPEAERRGRGLQWWWSSAVLVRHGSVRCQSGVRWRARTAGPGFAARPRRSQVVPEQQVS